MEYSVYRHNKTGNLYIVLHERVLDCTNGNEERVLLVYKEVIKEGDSFVLGNTYTFVREVEEFYQKFTFYECTENVIS